MHCCRTHKLYIYITHFVSSSYYMQSNIKNCKEEICINLSVFTFLSANFRSHIFPFYPIALSSVIKAIFRCHSVSRDINFGWKIFTVTCLSMYSTGCFPIACIDLCRTVVKKQISNCRITAP